MMANQDAAAGGVLSTLKEAGETLADAKQDVRGCDVIAANGETVGKVVALMVDNDHQQANVRFLRVEAVDVLKVGPKTWLIPVEAIARIDPDQVFVDQSREQIAGSPGYDPTVVSTAGTGLYDYYGYAPYWDFGYRYPLWWQSGAPASRS